MTREEQVLIDTLRLMKKASQETKNLRAVLIQSFLAENGPLGEEAGAKVRELLKD